MIKKLICVLFLLALIMGTSQARQYYGNITCGKCIQQKCPQSQENCQFINGGPFKNYEVGCFQYPPSACKSFVLSFRIFECGACPNTCCIESPGVRPQCVDDDDKQLCTFTVIQQFKYDLKQIKQIKNLSA